MIIKSDIVLRCKAKGNSRLERVKDSSVEMKNALFWLTWQT